MAKTDKQVVSGIHRPVCKKCHVEFRPETNGVGVLDLNERGEPYELFDADLWKCPSCGFEVVGGFGYGAVSAHYKADFLKHIASYRTLALLIENRG
jgi:transposase-like protein